MTAAGVDTRPSEPVGATLSEKPLQEIHGFTPWSSMERIVALSPDMTAPTSPTRPGLRFCSGLLPSLDGLKLPGEVAGKLILLQREHTFKLRTSIRASVTGVESRKPDHTRGGISSAVLNRCNVRQDSALNSLRSATIAKV
jgi:hypothetical protein